MKLTYTREYTKDGKAARVTFSLINDVRNNSTYIVLTQGGIRIGKTSVMKSGDKTERGAKAQKAADALLAGLGYVRY